MPRPGEFAPLSHDLSDEQRQLAEAVQRLILQAGPSGAEVARRMELAGGGSEGCLSKQALSDLARGQRRRRPREEPLRRLHELAREGVREKAQAGGVLDDVISWAKLDRLRCALPAPGLQPTSGDAITRWHAEGKGGATTALEGVLAETAGPAGLGVQGRPEGWRQGAGPSAEGDRPPVMDRHWPSAALLEAYVSAGDRPRAVGILRYVGAEREPAEAAAALVACAERGLGLALDEIRHHVVRRPAADQIKILWQLEGYGAQGELSSLLRLAAERLGG